MLYKFSVAYCLINRKLQTKKHGIFIVVLIYDMGDGRVKSISISHRVYGRVSAEMDIQSRRDVVEFLQRFEDSSSTVLSTVTDGYHYHLVEAATAERLDLIEGELREQGFLAPLAGASRMPPRGGGTGRLCGLYHRHYGSSTKKRCQRIYHRHRKQHCGASVVCLPGKAFLPADRTALIERKIQIPCRGCLFSAGDLFALWGSRKAQGVGFGPCV